jgi:hypothetical protein
LSRPSGRWRLVQHGRGRARQRMAAGERGRVRDDVVAIGTDEMNALTWESIFVAPKGGGNSPER